MFVKVHQPLAATGGDNRGSSSNLFDYLNKEDKGKDLIEKTGFFTQSEERLTKDSAMEIIDNNNKNLGKDDYKFYMVSINPSQKELKHLSGGKMVDEMSRKELKQFESKLERYTHNVMDEYAKSFNKGIGNKDLVYVAKIEHQRTHGGKDKEVLEGIKKSGDIKEGLQSHVHVVVSRNNVQQNMKLSPLSKQRPNANSSLNGKQVQQGFEHMGFKQRSQEAFDKQFQYNREKEESIKGSEKQNKFDTSKQLQNLNPLNSHSDIDRRMNRESGVTRFKDSVRHNKEQHFHPFDHMKKQLEKEINKDLGKFL